MGNTGRHGDASRGRVLYMLAWLVICLLVNLGAAVLFEYYTVSTSEGQIIFSLSMSWQLILFIIESITIIIQMIIVIRSLKQYADKYHSVIMSAGLVAAAAAAAAALAMIITQGIRSAPAIFFVVYAVCIIVLRTVVLPRILDRFAVNRAIA